MNNKEIISGVNTFLANHLDAEYWTKKTDQEKSNLINMAKFDICAAVPFLNVDTLEDPESASSRPCKADFFLAAIAEQSLYLSRTHAERSTGRVVQSQSIGNLSQTYQYLAGDGELCARANSFVKKLRNSLPRILNFQRG
ncbi:MAG: hypothetical protein IKA79_09300 [Lentisphaeria bacterium]|nr:hypothetical protein [Lentisphaeria bacterium]